MNDPGDVLGPIIMIGTFLFFAFTAWWLSRWSSEKLDEQQREKGEESP